MWDTIKRRSLYISHAQNCRHKKTLQTGRRTFRLFIPRLKRLTATNEDIVLLQVVREFVLNA